jgi:hypothetical protein
MFQANTSRQDKLQESVLSLLDRMSTREDAMRKEHDLMHEDKQKSIKHMTQEPQTLNPKP